MFLFCLEVKKLDTSVKSYDSAKDTKVGWEKKVNQGKAKMIVSTSKALASSKDRRTMALLVCTTKQKTAFTLYACVLKFRVNDFYFESIFLRNN